ncbi:Hachiman antiphage defense system protein HamA, partial [Campylobacter coli]
ELDNLAKHHNIETSTLTNFKQIINGNINLDNLKGILHVPISIIYDCDYTKKIEEITDDYKTTIKNFHKENGNKISEEIKNLLNEITYIDRIKFHIILFPIPDKEEIISKINKIFESYRNAD